MKPADHCRPALCRWMFWETSNLAKTQTEVEPVPVSFFISKCQYWVLGSQMCLKTIPNHYTLLERKIRSLCSWAFKPIPPCPLNPFVCGVLVIPTRSVCCFGCPYSLLSKGNKFIERLIRTVSQVSVIETLGAFIDSSDMLIK